MPEDNTHDMLNETSEKIDVLVGPRRSFGAKRAGIAPLSASTLDAAKRTIERNFGITPEREIISRILKTKSSHDEATAVYKYRMDIEQATILAQTAGPNMAIEVDSHLQYGAYGPSAMMQQIMGRTSFSGAPLKEATVKIRVIGEGDKPLPNVSVTMEAAGFPQEAATNARGEVTLKLFQLPGGNQVKSVFVRPKEGHWNRIINSPTLSASGINVIRLKPISDTVPNFPAGAHYGYGQKLMGLDQLPDEYTGKGVKIAIIDSGADNAHPSLSHIKQGFDMTNIKDKRPDTSTWKDDVIGHGSHCAGIITGNSGNEDAIRGFAPEAEIIVMKVFPGGQFSSLLDALSKCVEEEVDVVNMSLGGGEKSEMVEQAIEECVQNGIACIVAAGNSGGPVQYPASSPSVLAVAAIGQLNQFPGDTWEASTMQPSLVAGDGLFSPSFTCHGSEIAVAGPGVGIISTVPGGKFDPQSGTSMATPHICGMAALVIAHHPDFKGMPRDGNRVAHLFNLMRSNSQALPLASEFVGSGMPVLHGLVAAFDAGRAMETEAAAGDFAAASAGPGQAIGGYPNRGRAPRGYPIYPNYGQPQRPIYGYPPVPQGYVNGAGGYAPQGYVYR